MNHAWTEKKRGSEHVCGLGDLQDFGIYEQNCREKKIIKLELVVTL